MTRFAIGTKYGKGHGKVCTIVDIHTTRNTAGEIVKERYVATHEFLGQQVTDYDVCDTTVARGLILPAIIPEHGEAAEREWVVEFGCDEAVIRKGTYDQANHPDDLGCAPTRIRPAAEVRITEMWDKNGELRCEFEPD